MDKKKYCYGIIGIIFAVFNISAFLCADTEPLSFWIALAFTNFAILSELYICHVAFDAATTVKKTFLGIPIAYVGALYLLVQFVISIYLFYTQTVYEIAIILCVVSTGLFAILLISAHFGRIVVKGVEERVTKQVSFVETLRMQVDCLILKTEDNETKKELQNLLEILRYSDPISMSQLEIIESHITQKVATIDVTKNCVATIKEVSNLLVQRNIQCKAVKE